MHAMHITQWWQHLHKCWVETHSNTVMSTYKIHVDNMVSDCYFYSFLSCIHVYWMRNVTQRAFLMLIRCRNIFLCFSTLFQHRNFDFDESTSISTVFIRHWKNIKKAYSTSNQRWNFDLPAGYALFVHAIQKISLAMDLYNYSCNMSPFTSDIFLYFMNKQWITKSIFSFSWKTWWRFVTMAVI